MQKTTQNNEDRVRQLTAGRRLMLYVYIINNKKKDSR